jgi:predicted MFS family arabinose efflux permease
MGLWSDALGRRKPLVAAGVVMTLVGALGLGLAPTPLFLTVARTATGIGASVWVLFSVYFVSFYPPENTGRAMGFINFVQSTALVVASLGGGIIAQALGSRQTFFGATLLGALSLFALLPASEPRPSIRGTFTWRDFARVAANPHLLVVSAMGILLQFAQFATVFGFIPVYGAKIGASNADLGILTMLATMSGAVSALAAPRVAERWGYAFALLLGSMLMAVSLVAVPFITSVLVLDADQFVAGLGRGMLVTTLMTQSIQAVPSHQRATAMGIYQATYSVGMLLGPLISGFVADSQGLAVVFYLSAAISLMIAVTAYLPIKSRPS